MMKRREKKKSGLTGYFDYGLVMVVVCLLVFGLVMLYSTSSYTAALRQRDAAYFVKRQVLFDGLGLLGMFIASRIDYHKYARYIVYFYFGVFALCVYALFFGTELNNSARWITIHLGRISFNFQPSELGKLAIIILFAALIESTGKKMNRIRTLIKYLIVLLPLLAVVALTNLSTAVILAGIWFIMVFVARKDYRPFLILIALAVALVFLISFAGKDYRGGRIKAWLNPAEAGDKGFQTIQGLYAIGSGGFFGKGLGESMQKKFVPEVQNDMIFSIICEELGIFGAICVILLFLLLLWRLLIIADSARDQFGSFIAIGALAHISIQVILNIAVVTNTIPNTGITLPFISYGGSATVVLLFEMGIVLSVSRQVEFEA